MRWTGLVSAVCLLIISGCNSAESTFAPTGSSSLGSSSWSTAAPKMAPMSTFTAPGFLFGDSSPPLVLADAVASEKAADRQAKQQTARGVLTAGSFDDNVDPNLFASLVKKFGQSRGLGDLPGKLQGRRLLVIVKDSKGKPVGDARVRLSGGANSSVELVTRSDGRAVFVLSWDLLPDDQNLIATVTGPKGGNPVAETIAFNAPQWEVTLPGSQSTLPRNLDLAIVLDTTGSMGDELEYLKTEIRGIAQTIAKKFPEVQQHFALVLYRDEGDDYVVRRFDFTNSVNEFHKRLSAQGAGGGGDYPEAMHKGLEEALQLRWKEKDAARVLFLVGDAPPHPQHMGRAMTAVNNLRKKGVAIYPVACSGYDDSCEFVMRSCALLTGSKFLFLTDDSGVGDGHAEPKIPYYQVEHLDRLMVRVISSELAGQHIPANSADIIRTVGKKVN